MLVCCPQCEHPVDVPADSAREPTCAHCGFTIKRGTIDMILGSKNHAVEQESPRAVSPRDTVPSQPVDRDAQTFAASGPAAQDAPSGTEPERRATNSRDAETDIDPPRVLRYFGDYELLDEIARGGMGIVYKARQTSLNRVVAVKMILGGQVAGPDEIQRFHAEAEAAANLHHPNIVAIHEVGAHDGRHYFSMDFVAGTSLSALVRDNPLPAARAAVYTRKIAEAIHYAHQQGILHRDLKPSNVLIDQFDEPRVTDFGLAKRLESQSGLTASGAVLGTPSYMPPEQAAGEHHRVGPTSDVYSLGAMLYELVTGRAPFRAESPIETMRQVLDVEPAAPRLLNPRVDRDVETICLKCLQKEPERRYGSAQLLADDLGRYLRREPILARPIGQVERFARWCRRDPWVASLGAAVALLLVAVAAGSTVAAIRIAHEQAETETARKAAHASYEAAEAQRIRAEASFQKAREAVNQMLTRVADNVLLELPQTEPVRRALLQDALVFYQGFLRERAADPGVQHETGRAYHRVGEILRMLGDDDESKDAYEHAIELFTVLVRRFPESRQYARDLAETYNWLGELHRMAGQLDDAERAYRNAVDLQQPLAAATEPAHSSELARSLFNLGIVLTNTGRTGDADSAYERAATILEELCAKHHGEPQYRLELARCLINRGILLKDTRKFAEAEAAYAHGIRILEELLAEHPTKSEYRLALASCSNNMGNLLLRDASRYGEATGRFRRAFDLYEKLAGDFPSVPGHRKELANSCNSVATLLSRTGQPTEARTIWQRGREIAERLIQEDAGVPDYHRVLGGILGNLAGSLTDDDAERARELLEEAVRHERIALDSNPQHPTYRQFLRTDYLRLARLVARQGDHARAAETVRLANELSLDSPQDCQRAAAILCECVTRAESDGDLADERKQDLATAYAERAVAILRRAVEKGYRNLESLRTDESLMPLRQRLEFQELVAELEAKVRAVSGSSPK